MTSVLLLQALCKFLRDTVKNYAAAQGEQGGFRPPEVYDWFLPFKNPKMPDKIDFPYIVPKIINGEDAARENHVLQSDVVIEISFGVYSESKDAGGNIHPDGAYDLLNLMEYVRIALLRQERLDKRYKIEIPYKWDIPDEQPYPLWVGRARTIWTIQSVIPETGVDIIYGI
ncbi:hypothetical protein M5X06_31590 [Paenibacillus alvei]|uniref:Uncharacterized protein n=1 Tax=Paenibacillus alvei TaxID=44250 RepID=A0ABT4H123_PAEAL|nr:hypothetical protein [Paenibacillus alvei]MCY9762614.1 hypothetical protein [Paenibacillus alvei]MCY9771320.1 hypothetical protein [Paenibacillus alvei]